MRIVHCEPSFTDTRGSITDILQDVPMEHAMLLVTKTGARRGDHFHKLSTQYLYVLSGRLEMLSRIGDESKLSLVRVGDLVINEPLEVHSLVALEDSVCLVLVHGLRSGSNYEQDTFKERV